MANVETLAAATRYFEETAAPATPATGKLAVYAKTDGKIYSKNDAGTESDLTAGGGPSESSDPYGWGFPFTVDPGANTAVQSIVGTVCRYMRVIGTGAITKVALRVGTSAGNIGVAHYDTTGSGRTAEPSARQATTGAIACPASGYAEVTLSATINAGEWLAISASSTVTVHALTGSGDGSVMLGRSRAESAADPPPATATPTGNDRTMMLIGVP